MDKIKIIFDCTTKILTKADKLCLIHKLESDKKLNKNELAWVDFLNYDQMSIRKSRKASLTKSIRINVGTINKISGVAIDSNKVLENLQKAFDGQGVISLRQKVNAVKKMSEHMDIEDTAKALACILLGEE